MKRILILTDSLALPRDAPEVVEYEQTWVYMLQKAHKDISFHQVSIGGASVSTLVKQATKFHKMFRPDWVVVQSGIVDCAPRALSERERQLLRKNKLIAKTIGNVLMRNASLLRKLRDITYTSLSEFSSQISILQKEFGAENVFWLGILPANPEYEKKVPGITDGIGKYNTIIAKKVGGNFIETAGFPMDGVMSDHHHLNPKGHDFIKEKVEQILKGNKAKH